MKCKADAHCYIQRAMQVRAYAITNTHYTLSLEDLQFLWILKISV